MVPDQKIISSSKVKQGRGGTRAFQILALGLALAIIAFAAFMFWRPA